MKTLCSGTIPTIIRNYLYRKSTYMYFVSSLHCSGTHTHAGPAGFAYYAMYDITSWGFQKENHEVIVHGIVKGVHIHGCAHA